MFNTSTTQPGEVDSHFTVDFTEQSPVRSLPSTPLTACTLNGEGNTLYTDLYTDKFTLIIICGFGMFCRIHSLNLGILEETHARNTVDDLEKNPADRESIADDHHNP